ncbi:hypothetical protein ABH923_003299 [Leifsonia sp. EB41]
MGGARCGGVARVPRCRHLPPGLHPDSRVHPALLHDDVGRTVHLPGRRGEGVGCRRPRGGRRRHVHDRGSRPHRRRRGGRRRRRCGWYRRRRRLRPSRRPRRDDGHFDGDGAGHSRDHPCREGRRCAPRDGGGPGDARRRHGDGDRRGLHRDLRVRDHDRALVRRLQRYVCARHGQHRQQPASCRRRDAGDCAECHAARGRNVPRGIRARRGRHCVGLGLRLLPQPGEARDPTTRCSR